MAKLKPTYRTPYFYPSKGDLLSPEQTATMWQSTPVSGGRLAVDMEDLDGLRSDWFEVRDTHGKWIEARFLCVPTFANGQKLWLVTHTSY